ncbi:MAG: hypothetical protein JWN17_985 [Frankiales bacterium]|nr:hypothetical protein [Frankiales bacterium]
MPRLSPRARRAGVALGAAVLLATALPALSAGGAAAATPAAGTVSATSPTLTYTSGPFTVSNATGNAGTVDCSAPNSCDDFALTVATPADYATGHTLKVSTAWTGAAADFDVYLLDSAGHEVASAATSANPEVILTVPTAGAYTVRVVPFTVAGDSFTTTVSLAGTPAAPAPSTVAAPVYSNHPAPATLPDVHNAGEPSIGYDRKTGAAMYQASLSTYRATFDDATAPATASFADVSANAASGCPGGSTTSLDPILATEPTTGRTIESQLLDVRAAGSLSCVTGDAGKTWSTSQGGGLNSAVDHQTLGWGPYAPGGVAALRTSPSELYYCSQDIADASCSTSSDGGTTFTPAVPMYTLQSCGGLHGHVKVGPDGTAYVPNKSCNGHPAVVVSQDNGLTWAIRPVPGGTSGDSDPSVAVAKDGTVYLGWNGADNHPYTAVSHDKGVTWTDVQDVGAQLGIVNTAFPAAVAGDGDRAAVAFVGTTTPGNSQETDVFQGVWHLYVMSTFDGGKSWTTSDATGADPVQRGSICTAGTTCGTDRNLLDFIDATVDDKGRVLVGYADGCIAACVTTATPTATTTGYRDAYATIARLSSGLTLYAANDPAPVAAPVANLTVSALQSSTAGAKSTLSALVRNTGTAPASGVVVAFSSAQAALGSTSPVPLAPGASTRVSVAWKAPAKPTAVVAVVDPARTVAESDESDNRATAQLSR